MKKRLAAVLTLLLAALLCGCAAQPVSSQSFALDTVVTITIYAGGGEAEAQAALARVDECEALLSAHRQGSDIVFLNGASARAARSSIWAQSRKARWATRSWRA